MGDGGCGFYDLKRSLKFSYQIKLNRPDLWMNLSVSRSISLLTSSGKFLSPYNKICIRRLFLRSLCPYRIKAETPARRSLRGTAREGQSNKVFRILNTIVRRAHRIYGILKVVLEFVKIQFTETNPELSEI